MVHVIWKDQEREQDFYVHFLKDAEWTLCGAAVEGGSFRIDGQYFVKVNDKVTCPQCIEIVQECQRVKISEFVAKQ